MLVAMLLALLDWDEVASYGWYVAREHYVAIFIIGWLIVISHEFAHGLTCKAFGGRATEVGVLLIYYFLPALYCNVSGIHLIPQRSRRLWVIAAGVWWQLIVGAFALLFWFIIAPYTLLSDLAFIFFIGSVVDVIFNANPLIKLDGYYFLSQWLRLPNLMDRSRAYWRGLLRQIISGERDETAARYSRRERSIYATFGLLSFIYTVGLRAAILYFVGAYLMDSFQLLGLLLTVALALIYARQLLRQLISAARATAVRITRTLCRKRLEGIMALNDKAAEQDTSGAASSKSTTGEVKPAKWRRRLIPLTACLLIGAGLLMPWTASVGNYGTLVAIPDQETIIRAPESASLVALQVRPGDQIAGGAVIGQMGNYDLEEQIIQVQSELARTSADYDRLSGELRARQEAAIRAETQLRQRQRDYDEMETERRQIAEGQQFEKGGARIVAASSPAGYQSDQAAALYPAALAVLQAEVDSCRAQLDEAMAQRDRARKLSADGIAPRSELDAAETRAATLGSALAAARQRLEAALVEHRRKHTSATTEMSLAHSDLSAERLQIANLGGELNVMREVIAALEARRGLLQKKRARFELVTPRAGAVFGEELPRSIGQHFQKGAEICRVADTRQLLVRIQVPEREIGDVRAGQPVRLKVRAFPDRTFRGVVSKIAGESEPDQNSQASYRVELTIENADGLLRPGMTAFARIDFYRRMVGRIVLHKIKQALRPELWML
jgi:multidrug resistance efflux pump